MCLNPRESSFSTFSIHLLQSKAQNYHGTGLGARCSPVFIHLLCVLNALSWEWFISLGSHALRLGVVFGILGGRWEDSNGKALKPLREWIWRSCFPDSFGAGPSAKALAFVKWSFPCNSLFGSQYHSFPCPFRPLGGNSSPLLPGPELTLLCCPP